MFTNKNLDEFTRRFQTVPENIIREYCQHLFLSNLYQVKGADRLLFKGGTALRIVFQSPRFSEDLDFTGSLITQPEIETIFAETLAQLEHSGIDVVLNIAKNTTGGYIGNATLTVYEEKTEVHIEVSLRTGKPMSGKQSVILNEYIPPYTLTHLPQEEIIQGKLDALLNRHKPRDFYDYFFLLSSGKYPMVRERSTMEQVIKLLDESRIDFRGELKEFLPASHGLMMKDFKATLKQKTEQFL